jgi:hypothetical protein
MKYAAAHIARSQPLWMASAPHICVPGRPFLQERDPNGSFLCPPFPVSSILSSKSRLDLTLSSKGCALAAWSDGRSDGGNIYAQDIKPDCSLGQKL